MPMSVRTCRQKLCGDEYSSWFETLAIESPGFSSARAEESTHERAGEHAEAFGERAHRRAAPRRAEERVEEAPTVIRDSDEIEGERAEREPDDVVALFIGERIAEVAPARAFPHIHQRAMWVHSSGPHRATERRIARTRWARRSTATSSTVWRCSV